MTPVRAGQSGFRISTVLAALGACAALLSACGGKVVVDGGGAGAGGSATTTVTVASTTGTGGSSADCSALVQDFNARLGDAQTCDPTVNSEQCTGGGRRRRHVQLSGGRRGVWTLQLRSLPFSAARPVALRSGQQPLHPFDLQLSC